MGKVTVAVGGRLRDIRRARNIPLAEVVGLVNKSTISRFERNQTMLANSFVNNYMEASGIFYIDVRPQNGFDELENLMTRVIDCANSFNPQQADQLIALFMVENHDVQDYVQTLLTIVRTALTAPVGTILDAALCTTLRTVFVQRSAWYGFERAVFPLVIAHLDVELRAEILQAMRVNAPLINDTTLNLGSYIALQFNLMAAFYRMGELEAARAILRAAQVKFQPFGWTRFEMMRDWWTAILNPNRDRVHLVRQHLDQLAVIGMHQWRAERLHLLQVAEPELAALVTVEVAVDED